MLTTGTADYTCVIRFALRAIASHCLDDFIGIKHHGRKSRRKIVSGEYKYFVLFKLGITFSSSESTQHIIDHYQSSFNIFTLSKAKFFFQVIDD